jgi:hypothetical protein
MNPVHILTPFVLALTFHLILGLVSCFLPSDVPNKIVYAFRVFVMRASYPVHLTLLNLIIPITRCEEHKLWSYLLHSFLIRTLWFCFYNVIRFSRSLNHKCDYYFLAAPRIQHWGLSIFANHQCLLWENLSLFSLCDWRRRNRAP